MHFRKLIVFHKCSFKFELASTHQTVIFDFILRYFGFFLLILFRQLNVSLMLIYKYIQQQFSIYFQIFILVAEQWSFSSITVLFPIFLTGFQLIFWHFFTIIPPLFWSSRRFHPNPKNLGKSLFFSLHFSLN